MGNIFVIMLLIGSAVTVVAVVALTVAIVLDMFKKR